MVQVAWVDVLLSQNKVEEAKVAAQEVLAKKPTNDKVLSYLTTLLKRMGQDQEVVNLYKHGWETNQKDAAASRWFGHELFAAYVRQGDYVSQKKFAQELHKKFKEDKYMIWNLVVTTIEARNSKDVVKAPMLLNIATKLFGSHFSKAQSPKAQEILFYIDLLKHQNLIGDAIQILEGDVGKKACKIEQQRLETVANLYLQQANWEKAGESFNYLLSNCGDDWNWFLGYIDATLKLGDSKKQTPIMEQFINSLQQKYPLSRGVQLALCELAKRENNEEKLAKLLVNYFEVFGAKPCAYKDMRPYLAPLKHNSTKLLEQFQSNITDKMEARVKCEKLITLESIKRSLIEKNAQTAIESAKHLFDLYLWSNSLPGESTRLKTDLGIGDNFANLAVHYLLDYWELTDSVTTLIEILVVLEYGILKSPSNHHFKVLLMRVYGYFGASQRVSEIWDSMDIRHVQVESVSHLVLNDYLTFHSHNQSTKLIKELTKFHSDWEIKAPHSFLEAYEHESYTMITEFMEFNNRLTNSLHLNATLTEQLHSIINLKSSPMEELKKQFSQNGPTLNAIKKFVTEKPILSSNDDWKFLLQFNLNDSHVWEWEKLTLDQFGALYNIKGAQHQHLLLKLRNIQILLLNTFIEKNLVEEQFFKLYGEVCEELGYFKRGEVYSGDVVSSLSFAAFNAWIVYFTYDLHQQVLQCSEAVNSGAANSAEVVKGLCTKLELLSGLLQTKLKKYGEHEIRNIHLAPLLQSLNHCFILLPIYNDTVPQRLKKNASNDLKEVHNQYKQAMKAFLNIQKEFYVQQQGILESNADPKLPGVPFLLNYPEENTSILKQVEQNILHGMRCLNTILLDLVRERSRSLQKR
uniref:Uncharacterized protein n=1 Tax=Arcella intermedia TaxID=1963864 RepID=A0A6B2KXY2_9EUKA